jgi:hypothetical protein
VTAAKVIEETGGLAPDDQAKVIQHAFERHRQLSTDELGGWPSVWRLPTIPQKSSD